jgi:hypothetical protein
VVLKKAWVLDAVARAPGTLTFTTESPYMLTFEIVWSRRGSSTPARRVAYAYSCGASRLWAPISTPWCANFC